MRHDTSMPVPGGWGVMIFTVRVGHCACATAAPGANAAPTSNAATIACAKFRMIPSPCRADSAAQLPYV
jgi:hypothetical protein